MRARRLVLAGLALALCCAGAGLAGQGALIAAKAQVAQLLLDRAWARAEAGEAAPKPWPWADTWAVARIDAPRLNRSAVVLAEAGGEAMAFGPAHLGQTPAPGRPGVSVIAAHRDTHFAFLKDLVPGDALTVETPDGPVAFTVTGTQVVRFDESGVQPEGGPPRLALVTCYPFGASRRGPLRYIVWAEMADEAPERRTALLTPD